MRGSVLALFIGLWAVPACLELGGVDEASNEQGGSGGIHGDSSFPDSAGGTGSGGTAGSAGSAGSAGQAGAAGAASGGSGGVSWNLHTFDVVNGAWSSIALSSVWAGANAPPSSGIVAVTQLEHFDRLLVFADDGNFYLRADGVWQPPTPINEKFPALATLQLKSVWHVSSPPGTPLDEGLTFIANPTAVSYEYHANDAIVFVDQKTMNDDPPPAPPLNTGSCVFDFEIRYPAKYGAADYYLFYSYYTDGNLYQFDAAFQWLQWPVLSSPFWSGKANAPDPASIRAAWFDEKYDRAQLVGP